MRNLVNEFNRFNVHAEQKAYPSGARNLFNTLLFHFNGHKWPEALVMTESTLCALTRLPKTTCHAAKVFLREEGYINWKIVRGKTVIELTEPSDKWLTCSTVDALPVDSSFGMPLNERTENGLKKTGQTASRLGFMAHVL